MVNETLKRIAPNPLIIESEKIDGFLNGMSIPSDAKGIILPNVKFYDEHTKHYVSGVNNPDAITDDSIRRISIDMGNGRTRYFKQIDHMDGTEKTSTTGLKASA